MAQPFNTSAFVLHVVIVSLSIVGLAARPTGLKDDLITQVCSKTSNVTLCNYKLRNDSGSAQADLKGLGSIALKTLSSDAEMVRTMVQALENGTTDPILKDRNNECDGNYGDSITGLSDAAYPLSEEDYQTFLVEVQSVSYGPTSCNGKFSEPPSEDPSFERANRDFIDECSILVVIAKDLLGGK